MENKVYTAMVSAFEGNLNNEDFFRGNTYKEKLFSPLRSYAKETLGNGFSVSLSTSPLFDGKKITRYDMVIKKDGKVVGLFKARCSGRSLNKNLRNIPKVMDELFDAKKHDDSIITMSSVAYSSYDFTSNEELSVRSANKLVEIMSDSDHKSDFYSVDVIDIFEQEGAGVFRKYPGKYSVLLKSQGIVDSFKLFINKVSIQNR